MKLNWGYKVLLILGASCGMLLLSFFLAPRYPKLHLPQLSSILKDSVELIPLYNKGETKLFDVALEKEDSSSWYFPVDSFQTFDLQECEQIIHASGYQNEMEPFYRKLQKLKDEPSLIRVLHFGDSQIEGDRITGVLRSNLQAYFGGCGVGFLPISESRVSRTNVRKTVKGWNRFKVFGTMQKGVHNSYGFTGYFHRTNGSKEPASISVKPNKRYFKGCSKFEQVQVMYRDKEKTGGPIFTFGDSIIKTKDQKRGMIHLSSWDQEGFGKNGWKMSAVADSSVDFYGISFEGKSGVSVANVAMRGSSGVEFTQMNTRDLRNQIQLLKPSLIVYQFGINVIPFILDDYRFYELMVYNQLKLLRSYAPDAAVLVIGVSDMARKENGEYISFPNIDKVKLAQKNAAKKAGCAFWDLHQVMGGKNAMKDWVIANPPLAEKDYTHFNYSGAKLVGKKLYEAIMADYFAFKRNTIN